MSSHRSCPPAGHTWSDPVLDCLTDAVLTVAPDGTIKHANRATESIFGWRPEELVGQPIELLVPESYRDHHRRDRARFDRKPAARPMGALTLRARHRNSKTFFAEVALSPCECGEVTAVVRDVSDRIERQNSLIGRDRVDTFELAAAGLVHEINNPLAFVVPNLDLAVTLLERPIPEAQRAVAAIRDARTGVGQIVEVLRAFRGIARRSDRTTAQTPFDTIESVLRLVRTRLRGHASVIRELSDLPEVRIDSTRLGQVLLNLLLNASQAFDTDDAQQNVIVVRTYTDDLGRAMIEIADNAGGIPETIRDRIFDPFFTTKSSGTGLGLAVSKTALNEAGGDLSFTTDDHGTTFQIVLPAAAASEAPAADNGGQASA